MPWGDYGEILYAGINVRDKETGKFYVSRTAPFLPTVYRDPQEPFLFVTDSLKKKLEQTDLKEISFQQAVKDRIVSLAWEKWDLSAPEPAVYPSGDMDAEEYILRRKRNEQLAEAMENIWVVLFPTKGLVTKGEHPTLVEQSIGGADIFTAEINSKNIFVSEKAKEWFDEHGNGCIEFELFPTTHATDDEIANLSKSADEKRLRKEKSEKMTDKDWHLWHRLIDESKKLLTEIDNAKREETKARWKQKALSNLLQARELYPLQDRENEMLETLQKDER